ncbi:alkaline phosphatase family protein [Spirochaetota bacterium]
MKKKAILTISAILAILIIITLFILYKDPFVITKPGKVYGKTKSERALIILSLDALMPEYLNKYKNLVPNIRKIMNESTYSGAVTVTFPSFTYPGHATIVTGVYPDKHGLFTFQFYGYTGCFQWSDQDR